MSANHNLEESQKPHCVAMIMDGNRRWAKEKGLSTFEGHLAGYQKLKKVVEWMIEAQIPHLIVYAFSTENWSRATDEVKYLMGLIEMALSKELHVFKDNEVRLRFIGDRSRAPEHIKKLLETGEEATKQCSRFNLTLAFSYGGRAEILNAVKELAQTKTPAEMLTLSEADFSQALWTKDIPDPDMIVRTSGEQRLSGFLPWQGVYSELFFIKTYWPDFSQQEFKDLIDQFATRHRRLGK